MKRFAQRFLTGISIASALMGAIGAVPAQAGAREIVGTIGELFLKGSLDGDNLFLVVGMEEGFRATQDIVDWAVDMEDLSDIGSDIYNKDHHGDYVDAVEDGVYFTRKAAPWIVKGPWRSLKHIPTSFRANIARAKEGYVSSENSVVGALKYGAWATWAVVQGTYYLVIEAPVVSIASMIGTVGAMPATIALNTLEIAGEAVVVTLKWAAGAVASIAVMSYALVSSSVSTVVALVGAGAVAVWQAGKWVLVSLPRTIKHPIQVRRETDEEYTAYGDVADRVAAFFADPASIGQPAVRIESKDKAYSRKIKLFVTNPELNQGAEIQVADVNVYVKNNRVRVEMAMTRKYYRELWEEAHLNGLSKKDFKEIVRQRLQTLIEGIDLAI